MTNRQIAYLMGAFFCSYGSPQLLRALGHYMS